MYEDKQKHFIKNIEIKNFKCFENFKAEGFGRVNLIGGKNNVGKTAFMEACFLASQMSTDDIFLDRKEINQIEFAYTILEFHRNPSDFLLDNENDELNQILNQIFDIEKVDVIREKVMFKINGKYLQLSEFGDGVKHFLNIILALYLNKDSILYLDEIENGIHYTNLDKMFYSELEQNHEVRGW